MPAIRPLLFLLLFILTACTSPETSDQKTASDDLSGWPHFGMEFPAASPLLYATGIISTQRHERDFTIDTSGKEIFYSYVHAGFSKSTLLTTRYEEGRWTTPETAPFSGSFNDLEPAFTPSGNRLFFVSRRPLAATDSTNDWNIWYADRSATGWGEAKSLELPFNTAGNEFYPSISRNGNLYFTAALEDSQGGEDIYVSTFENGRYTMPVNLGTAINSSSPEFNAYVSPDESFLVYSSFGREDGLGGGDLYISFRDESGRWMPAMNMGKEINTEKIDYCPFVSPDMKFFFFTSERLHDGFDTHLRMQVSQLHKMEDQPGNGLGDIYWVAFDRESWRKKILEGQTK